MNEIFRNMLISSATTTENANPFIGNVVELKDNQLRIEDLIAEGGFGYVFRVQELKTSKIFALKRLIGSDKESRDEIENEISMLSRVQTHKHIMDFHCWDKLKPNIYFLLCEYCGSGSLKDIPLPITNKQQLHRISYQICLALEKIHFLGIIHRDIKIENVLFDNLGFIKLCDFGSATDKTYTPDQNWTPIQRSLLEDEMTRHTTPMYRPPEILDTYLHYEINTAMDIWAYGCLLFCLRFGQHPFEDSSKLRIINCNFSIPISENASDTIITIIKSCLVVNPADRINASAIIKLLEDNFVDLNSPCVTPRKLPSTSPANTIINPPNIPAAQANISSNVPGIAHSYFSGFTRYIKDTSNKVMQTVQNSIARQDLDLSFFTSRFIVMSYPAEGLESAYRNHIEDVKAFLDSRGFQYMIINISGRSYDSHKFGPLIKVLDGGPSWKDPKKAPSLKSIIYLCDSIFKWTDQNTRNTTVIHCLDGKTNSAILTISFFLLIGLFDDYIKTYKFFNSNRMPVELSASQHRYLSYVSKLKQEKYFDYFSTKRYIIIRSITMHGIPVFTKLRDGCRPFIEIFSSLNTKLYSTCTEYDKLVQYPKGSSSKVAWKDINISSAFNEDLNLVIYHARSTIGSKMLNQAKLTPIKMTSVQFNLYFEHEHVDGPGKIMFSLKDLDIEEVDRFPTDFQIEFNFEICNSESKVSTVNSSEIQNEILLITKPECIFLNSREYDEFIEINGLASEPVKKPKPPSRPPPPSNSNFSPLFDSSILKEESNPLPNLNEITKPSSTRVENIINFDSSDQNKFDKYLENKKQHKSELLLNLSIEESNNEQNLPDDLFAKTSNHNVDLLSNNLNDKLTTDDLLGFNDSSIPVESKIFSASNIASLDPTPIDSKTVSSHSSKSSNSLQRNTSTPNLANFDPFGDLGTFLDFTTSDKAQTSTSIPRVSSYSTFSNETKSTSVSTNNQSVNSKPSKPDYSRHNFNDISSKTGIKAPRVVGNEFEDLLGSFIKPQTDTNPKSIAQLRKEEMLKGGSCDPIRIKIIEWTENKEKNIRALLCSLNTVVWDGCNWTPIGMHQLLTPNDVKKMYRKACLAVHPDKLVGSSHENLAKAIFVELNEAWSEFEKSQR